MDENKIYLYIKFSVVSLQCKMSISYYELNYQESTVCQKWQNFLNKAINTGSLDTLYHEVHTPVPWTLSIKHNIRHKSNCLHLTFSLVKPCFKTRHQQQLGNFPRVKLIYCNNYITYWKQKRSWPYKYQSLPQNSYILH